MKINILGSLLFLVLVSCASVNQCPPKKVFLEGSVYSNGEWRTIWTEIEKGELNNPNNYITEEQWKNLQNKIKFDCEECDETDKFKLDSTKEVERKSYKKTK